MGSPPIADKFLHWIKKRKSGEKFANGRSMGFYNPLNINRSPACEMPSMVALIKEQRNHKVSHILNLSILQRQLTGIWLECLPILKFSEQKRSQQGL